MTPEEFKIMLFKHHITRMNALASSSAVGAYASPTEWIQPPPQKGHHGLSKEARFPPAQQQQPLQKHQQQSQPHPQHRRKQSIGPVLTITVDDQDPGSQLQGATFSQEIGKDENEFLYEDKESADSEPSIFPSSSELRPLPESLDEVMEDMEERRLLYMTFRDLFVSSAETLESLAFGTKELIPAGTKWFMDAWVQYPLLDNEDFIFRTEIFGSMKRLLSTLDATHPPPANRDLVKRQIKSALVLESAIDLVKTLLVDVEGWKDPLLIQIAWTLRNRNLSENIDEVEFQEANDEIRRNIDRVTDRLLNLPFHHPRHVDEDRLVNYICDVRSRSDGYCLLLSLLEAQAVKILNLQRSSGVVQNFTRDVEDDEPSDYMMAGGRGIITRKTATKNEKQRKNKNTGGDRDFSNSAFAKLEWIVSFLAKQIHASPPSSALIVSALKMIRRVSVIVDSDATNMIWQENFGELQSRLEYSFSRQQNQGKSGIAPLFCNTMASNTPFFWKLKKKKEVTNQMSNNLLPESEPNSEDSLVKELKSVKHELEDVIGSVEEVSFQVEPHVERIAVKPSPSTSEKYSDEVLVSSQHGTLYLTRKDLIWSSSKSGSAGEVEPGIKIKHSSIIRFRAGRMDVPRVAVSGGGGVGGAISGMSAALLPNSSGLPSTSEKGGQGANGSKDGGPESNPSVAAGLASNEPRSSSVSVGATLEDGKLSFTKKTSLRFMPQAIKRKAYHIDIHTSEEVFKFYPLYETEIENMITSLSSVTGIVPFKDDEFIQSVLCKKLELTRRQALGYLAEEESPWIEHSADLVLVIEALTAENQPQRIMDMERLFHSCRIEIEVTKEAIYLLRKIWHQSQSEQVRLKVLSVVDRLLDKVIMRQGDPNFTITFKWLKHLEETVSPYKR